MNNDLDHSAFDQFAFILREIFIWSLTLCLVVTLIWYYWEIINATWAVIGVCALVAGRLLWRVRRG